MQFWRFYLKLHFRPLASPNFPEIHFQQLNLILRIISTNKNLSKTLVVTVSVETASSNGRSHIARAATKLEWTIFEWILASCKWLHSQSIFRANTGPFPVYYRSFNLELSLCFTKKFNLHIKWCYFGKIS